MHFHSEAAYSLDWRDRRKHSVRVRTGDSAQAMLFFIDEIDAVGAVRQDALSDAGGAGRELNNITASLMRAIDRYRSIDGFIVMAATNRLDGLAKPLPRAARCSGDGTVAYRDQQFAYG